MEATADAHDILQCPSCDVQVQRCEQKLAQHFEHELRQLKAAAVADSSGPAGSMAASENEVNGMESNSKQRRKPWTVFQRVQRNRQTRLKQRTRKRPAAQPLAIEQTLCPICNVSYPQEEIQRHAEQCLRRSTSLNGRGGGGGDDSSNEDEDGGDEYEEYEWAGQKRIRVSSLLQGGYASIGVGQSLSSGHNGSNGGGGGGGQDNEEEEEDLNVDEDDTHIYGPAQYGESDVIAPTGGGGGGSGLGQGGSASAEGDLTNYMRRLITGQNHNSNAEARTGNNSATTAGTSAEETNQNYIPSGGEDDNEANTNGCSTASSTVPVVVVASQQNQQIIIDSLKAKLRHYENHVESKFKCLICLDDYRNPAISVSCWHVHCEECWLRSLGARKLCPQCNLITSPKDLRRIYM